MKKLILSMAMVLSSLFAMSQMNQITWLNGRAVLGQPIAQIDSIKYGTMEDADQLVLWLPRSVVVHDTVIVHDTVLVHDTIMLHDFQGIATQPQNLEMVDLGLSVKWANLNLGATKPEEYGSYFAWGEVIAKTYFSPSNYKYGKVEGKDFIATKYCEADGKTTLEMRDDAAYITWGGDWRMPTQKEWNALKDSCTWEWTTVNNIIGYKVSGKKAGYTDKWIFLPAGGRISYGENYYVGEGGQYWSSTLKISDNVGYYQANPLMFDFHSEDFVITQSYPNACRTEFRHDGLPIRPVCK